MLVYRTESYRAVLSQYHETINRQRELFKLTPKEELFGREATPAKTEFQTKVSQAVILKKEVFRVSHQLLLIISATLECCYTSALKDPRRSPVLRGNFKLFCLISVCGVFLVA